MFILFVLESLFPLGQINYFALHCFWEVVLEFFPGNFACNLVGYLDTCKKNPEDKDAREFIQEELAINLN